MRACVSSYSFSALVRSGALRFLDIPAKVRDLGFEAMEFSALAVPEGVAKASFAADLAAGCRRAGLAVVNYAVPADLANGFGVPPEKEVERLRGELEVAGILGAPMMRHDATARFDGTFDQALPVLAERCRAVTEIGASMGVCTTVENHGYFVQDSDRMEKLAAAVGHPNFGLLLDIGNFLCVDEDPAAAVGRVARYARHVHAKDFHRKRGDAPEPGRGWFRSRAGNWLRGAILGHGEVPVGQCLAVLARAGYRGAASIEFEGIEDPITGISIGLENLKRCLAAVSEPS